MACMTTGWDSQEFAREWIAAWNSHDLEAILSHYDLHVVLTSPVAARIRNDPSGIVAGKAALRDYFQRGLELFPELHFELIDVMCGLSSVVLCYRNQKGGRTAEYMELDQNGKVVRVVANYSS
jgi:ketosteroid isomerase-like protein